MSELLTSSTIEPPDNYRLKILSVSAEILVMLAKPGRRAFEVVQNALPEDARCTGLGYDGRRREFILRIQSQSYDVVPWKSEIPPADPPQFQIIPLPYEPS